MTTLTGSLGTRLTVDSTPISLVPRLINKCIICAYSIQYIRYTSTYGIVYMHIWHSVHVHMA